MTTINTAIRALGAEKLPDGSYAYLAPETRTTWVVTTEDLEGFGVILEADEAYQESRERTRSDRLSDNAHGDGYSVWCAQSLATERRPLKGAQAWETFVGGQDPAEFMERSRCHDDIWTAVYRYVDVAETCQGLASWEVEGVRDALVDYITSSLNDSDDDSHPTTADLAATLTDAQVTVIRRYRDSDFYEHGRSSVVWLWCVTDHSTGSGMAVKALAAKGLADVWHEEDDDESGFALTALGEDVADIVLGDEEEEDRPGPTTCRIYLDGSPCNLDEVVVGLDDPHRVMDAVNFLQRSDAWGVVIDMGDEGLRTLTLHDRNRPGVVR